LLSFDEIAQGRQAHGWFLLFAGERWMLLLGALYLKDGRLCFVIFGLWGESGVGETAVLAVSVSYKLETIVSVCDKHLLKLLIY